MPRHKTKTTKTVDVDPETRKIDVTVEHERPGPPEPPPEPPADEETLKEALLYFKLKPENVLKARGCMEQDLAWLNEPKDHLGREPEFTMERLAGGIRIELHIGRTCFYLPEFETPCYWCGYDNQGRLVGKKVKGFVYKGATDVELHPPRCRVCPGCGRAIVDGKQDFRGIIGGKDATLDKPAIREAHKRGRPAHISPAAERE